MITLTLGGLVYLFRSPVRRFVAAGMARIPVTAEGLYNNGIDLFLKGAGRITDTIQNGSLHAYLAIVFGCAVVATGWPLIGSLSTTFQLPQVTGHMIALGLMIFIAAATLVVAATHRRLTAICGLGSVGAGVALVFLIYGAPDIALTQLLVETLTVIIVSLILLRLPGLERQRPRGLSRRALDAGLSLAAGLLVAALLMGITKGDLDLSLTAFYEAQSYLSAHGRNIVNVIIVDFRALDTLGEITVVVLAAWACIALMRRSGQRQKEL
jgi:multicomponent Na+:H+ antiporter subunit A